METRQIESSDRSSTTTTLPPSHPTAILNPLSISQPSLLPRSTSSTSTSERSSYFIIIIATSLWAWICQNRLAVLGAGVTFAGFVIGLAALVPAFAGQDLSQEALELARWTAMKDFIEQCWERKANGPVSDDCENAMAASLPPPPHMDFDKKMEKLVGRMSDSILTELRYDHTHVTERQTFGVVQLSACVGMYIVILLAWLYLQETFRRLRWRWSLSVPRREYVSYDGMADEEIGEFSYDYVELRPEPIRPSAIPDRLQSNTLEETARARLPEVRDENDTSRITRGVISSEPGFTIGYAPSYHDTMNSRTRSDEDSDDDAARLAWLSRKLDERRARVRVIDLIREESERTGDSTSFSPEFVEDSVDESPPPVKFESDVKTSRRESFIESFERASEKAASEKARLSARFEPRSDKAPSVRKRMNMIAQRNYQNSLRSDTFSGSVARVRRDEYAMSSSNAFGLLEGLEELSEDDGPDETRYLDHGTGLWGEGYVNHPM